MSDKQYGVWTIDNKGNDFLLVFKWGLSLSEAEHIAKRIAQAYGIGSTFVREI